MNKIIFIVVFLLFINHAFAQKESERYYIGYHRMESPMPPPRNYQLFRFSGNEVKMTTISVQGKIGSPLTSFYHVESCRYWSGNVDSLNNVVVFSDAYKLKYRIKKMTKRKLKLAVDGFVLKYSRVPEMTNIVLFPERFCSCSF